MGLAIEVGLYQFDDPEDEEFSVDDDLERINIFLQAHGLPPHAEPRNPSPFQPTGVEGFPYIFLHYLRRIMAHHLARPGAPILPVSGDDPQDAVLEAALQRTDNHLIAHADESGFYLPIDFPEVIVDERGEFIEDVYLGSSQRLAAELRDIAGCIGIDLDGERVPDGLADRIMADIKSEHPFFRERVVWLTLYEAAQHSICTGAALVFC